MRRGAASTRARTFRQVERWRRRKRPLERAGERARERVAREEVSGEVAHAAADGLDGVARLARGLVPLAKEGPAAEGARLVDGAAPFGREQRAAPRIVDEGELGLRARGPPRRDSAASQRVVDLAKLDGGRVRLAPGDPELAAPRVFRLARARARAGAAGHVGVGFVEELPKLGARRVVAPARCVSHAGRVH